MDSCRELSEPLLTALKRATGKYREVFMGVRWYSRMGNYVYSLILSDWQIRASVATTIGLQYKVFWGVLSWKALGY